MRRLYTRIYLYFLSLLLRVGVAASTVFGVGWRSAWEKLWTNRLARVASMIVAADQFNPARQRRTLKRLSEDLDLDVTFRDREGRAIYNVGVALPMPDEPEVLVSPLVGTHHGHKRFFVSAPVRDQVTDEVIGVLLATPTQRFFEGRHLWRPILTLAIVLVLVGLAVAPLARRLSRPVERLTEASRRLGDGDLSYRVKPRRRRHRWHPHRDRPDELEELTRAWNHMADRVERMVKGQRELLANVSHELRSPLARMQVALELLPETEEHAQRVVGIREDLGELERLIDDVLTSARLEATGLPARLERVALGPLIEGLVTRGQDDPLTQGKELTIAMPDPLLSVDGDPVLIKRALWNVVENAAKYGVAPIEIRAQRVAATVEISVADWGPGIAAADRERVFQPFVRADKARTPSPRHGYGLGLTLAQRVAEAHGGSIRVEDRDAAKQPPGCVVTLVLPALG